MNNTASFNAVNAAALDAFCDFARNLENRADVTKTVVNHFWTRDRMELMSIAIDERKSTNKRFNKPFPSWLAIAPKGHALRIIAERVVLADITAFESINLIQGLMSSLTNYTTGILIERERKEVLRESVEAAKELVEHKSAYGERDELLISFIKRFERAKAVIDEKPACDSSFEAWSKDALEGEVTLLNAQCQMVASSIAKNYGLQEPDICFQVVNHRGEFAYLQSFDNALEFKRLRAGIRPESNSPKTNKLDTSNF